MHLWITFSYVLLARFCLLRWTGFSEILDFVSSMFTLQQEVDHQEWQVWSLLEMYPLQIQWKVIWLRKTDLCTEYKSHLCP
jgi:hypothetical protein